MPKRSTSPVLLDECKTVSLSDLKGWGYLQPNQIKTGVINWSRHGLETGKIGILINTIADIPFLEFDYSCNGKPVQYRVSLVSLPSNIGKGQVWYFACPKTGKRCRKLYLVDSGFWHRTAFPGCFYEKQTLSKKNRTLHRLYELCYGVDSAYEILYSRYFKKTYAGQPTKRYLKVMQRIKIGEGISEEKLLSMP